MPFLPESTDRCSHNPSTHEVLIIKLNSSLKAEEFGVNSDLYTRADHIHSGVSTAVTSIGQPKQQVERNTENIFLS